MSKVYSTYEVKARFSEILRRVREGQTITVTYHGKPVAEIKPLQQKQTLDERLKELEERGWIVRNTAKGGGGLRTVVRKPGALKRFLEERD